MVFNNNEHLYVKINGIVKGDLSVPYNDGSKMDPKMAHYKHVKEKNQKNYDLLGPYIGTDAYFLVSDAYDPVVCGNQEYYIVEFKVC